MNPEETRRRIVEAVVALHQEVGPANTTVTGIAERAGVQRLTVYRHFPDERALIQACSAHWSAQHPPPDPGEWMGIADPAHRAVAALTGLYGFYRRGAPMMEKVLRDVEQVEPLREVMAPLGGFLAEMAGALAAGWEASPAAQRELRALTGHAVRFETWRSLSQEGLSDGDAARLLAGWLRSVAQGKEGEGRGGASRGGGGERAKG
jgi:AcrR family transcriptional regulator